MSRGGNCGSSPGYPGGYTTQEHQQYLTMMQERQRFQQKMQQQQQIGQQNQVGNGSLPFGK